MKVEIEINPMGKPRMTQSDKWKKRKVVVRYFSFKDHLNLICKSVGFVPGEVLGFEFHIPMPESWSKKKKAEMQGKPHQQKPDLDNLIKAVKDSLLKDDSHVWKYIEEPKKVWSETGKIILITR